MTVFNNLFSTSKHFVSSTIPQTFNFSYQKINFIYVFFFYSDCTICCVLVNIISTHVGK